MPDYKTLYFNLFNNVTDTIERLKQARQKAEQEYIGEEPQTEWIIGHKENETPKA